MCFPSTRLAVCLKDQPGVQAVQIRLLSNIHNVWIVTFSDVEPHWLFKNLQGHGVMVCYGHGFPEELLWLDLTSSGPSFSSNARLEW